MKLRSVSTERKPPECIVILSYHFYPSAAIGARRPTELARSLAANGTRVFVVTSQRQGRKEPVGEVIPGVFVHRVDEPAGLLLVRGLRWTKSALAKLLRRRDVSYETGETIDGPIRVPAGGLSWFHSVRRGVLTLLFAVDGSKRWSYRAARLGRRLANEHGARLLVSSGPPHSVHIGAASVASGALIPHVVDLRDPWSDNRIRPEHDARFGEIIDRMAEAHVMRRASVVVFTSMSPAAKLATRYPRLASRIFTVYNGFDGEIRKRTINTGHRLSILFAGTLYGQRNPFPFLEALERLLNQAHVDTSRVSAMFVGSCEEFAGVSLKDYCAGKKLQQVVTIRGSVPPAEIETLADNATLLLNMAQDQPLQVPAKTFEHLASSREIMLICEDESDTARLMDGIPGVIRVSPIDVDAMERQLLDLYQRHVIGGLITPTEQEDADRYSRRFQNDIFSQILARAVAERH